MFMPDIVLVCKPENALPVIFDSPHSGRIYPKDFDYSCGFQALRRCEDEYVDELFADVPDLGANLLCALFPRSYIDPNRAMNDIDPALLSAPWAGDMTIQPTERSRLGIGLIRRIVRGHIPVYTRSLGQGEILSRIQDYYLPYHTQLAQLIRTAHTQFGHAWHVSCHSMPDFTAKPRTPIGFSGATAKSVDFVIGDRDGTTSGADFTRSLRSFIRSLGYSVTLNDPFKGVEIIKRYGSPCNNIHSIQLEINKALYLHEETSEKSIDFKALKEDIHKISTFICAYAKDAIARSHVHA